MRTLAELAMSVRAFLELGGPVLYAIGAVTAVMWALILERIWHALRVLPGQARAARAEWLAERTGASAAGEPPGAADEWFALNTRAAILSRVGQSARRNLSLIETLLQVLPLLGLLGTVWGMVRVFDVMTVFGTGNARVMASGVSQATVPTMAGLVAALSGLCVVYWLRQRAGREMRDLEGALALETP